MSHYVWKEDLLTRPIQCALLQSQLTMGARHIALWLHKTLWTHIWIDHMYAYVARWDHCKV